jgi:hypothetical protein
MRLYTLHTTQSCSQGQSTHIVAASVNTQWWKLPQKFMSHPCSFLSITAGYFPYSFQAFTRLRTDWGKRKMFPDFTNLMYVLFHLEKYKIICWSGLSITTYCNSHMLRRLAGWFFSIDMLSLDSRWRHPYIHGLFSSMVCTWRPLVEKFSILLWQARVGSRGSQFCLPMRKWVLK